MLALRSSRDGHHSLPLFSPHREPSLEPADAANHEGRTLRVHRVWRRVRVELSVHAHLLFCRNKLKLQVLVLNTCAFWFLSFFFLCVCECTFVPKNLDRVRGHWDINSLINVCFVFFSFCRVSVTCVCSAHCMYVYIVNLSSLVYVDPSEGLVQSVFFFFLSSSRGVIMLPFVSSRTCEWKVSSFWLWKKKKITAS